jgi:hypothetical protein
VSRQFAEGTVVSVPKSKAEIEDLLTRYGADEFAQGTMPGRAVIMFSVLGRKVRFILTIPARDERRFTHRKARQSWKGPEENTDIQAQALWDAEHRRLWRSLALVIKAKLEAVSSGIVTFENEFLAHFVNPATGRTVGEDIGPQLLRMHESGKATPLLLGGGFGE